MDLKDLIKARDVEGIKAFMRQHGLILEGGRIKAGSADAVTKMKKLSGFWNQRQQAR